MNQHFLNNTYYGKITMNLHVWGLNFISQSSVIINITFSYYPIR